MVVVNLPNDRESLVARVKAGRVDPRIVWGMLALRPALALTFQALFALWYAFIGVEDAWRSAADWWLGSFALGEVVNLALLVHLSRREGIRFRDLFATRPGEWRQDLFWVVGAMILAGPIGFLPNLLLANALWGDPQVAADLIFRPLPIAGAWAIVLFFPVVHAVTEIPTYCGYVLPRLQTLRGDRLVPILIVAAVLSTQHAFLPLLLDWRFLVWRLLMFLPFALWITWVVDRRPTMLRYLVVAHYLLDFQLPLFVLSASTGGPG